MTRPKVFLDKLLALNSEGVNFTDEDLKDEVLTMAVAVIDVSKHARNGLLHVKSRVHFSFPAAIPGESDIFRPRLKFSPLAK